ncbi:MAG: hypothetical protein ACAI43_09250 [Phycisphaerae bacterium]
MGLERAQVLEHVIRCQQRRQVDAEALTRLQHAAAAGTLAAAMAGYVRHLAGGYEALRKGLRAEVEELRSEAVRASARGHRRTPEVVANLGLGLRHFLEFGVASGALTDAESASLWERGWRALCAAAEAQQHHQAAGEPTGRFFELLGSAIASGRAHLASRDGTCPARAEAWGWRRTGIGAVSEAWEAKGDRVGWVDGGDVYLEPSASFRVAQAMADAGTGLVITAQTLRKRMAEKGLLVVEAAREALTVRRMLEGRTRAVLQLAPGVMCTQPDIPDISDGQEAAQLHEDRTTDVSGGGNVRNVRSPEVEAPARLRSTKRNGERAKVTL